MEILSKFNTRVWLILFIFLQQNDVLVVAYLMYFVYKLVRGTVAFNIFIGVVLLYVTYLLVEALDMRLLSLLLGSVVAFGVIILIIIFQPEVREFLLVLGNNTLRGRFKFLDTLFGKQVIDREKSYTLKCLQDALLNLSKTKTGALIVMSNASQLNLEQSGVVLNAELSTSLLLNIFFKNAPLHDGAVLIHNSMIKAASCILPLSKNKTLGNELGLRHRAALGVTESNNVVAIVVSEETGEYAIAEHGVLKTDLSLDQLILVVADYLTKKNEI
jgi:uncharacterized protein (TIGR00159 family)